MARGKYAIKVEYANGTGVTLNEQQCSPLSLKAGCKVTFVKTNVTLKIMSLTPLSREWLSKKSNGKFEFGNNLDFPKEEFAEWKETTTKKFVPKDN